MDKKQNGGEKKTEFRIEIKVSSSFKLVWSKYQPKVTKNTEVIAIFLTVTFTIAEVTVRHSGDALNAEIASGSAIKKK